MGKIFRKIFAIIFKPRKGRLNQDFDQRYLQNGDFTDSLNTRSTTTDGSSTGDREIVIGNEVVFQLPSVSVQNKKYRVYLENTNVLRTVKIFTPNGLQVGLSATWTPTGAAGGLATAYTNATTTAVTSIGARLTAAGWTGGVDYIFGSLVVTVADTSGYFDITLAKVAGWDYELTLTTTADDTFPIVIQEAVDTSMIGDLICIGSYDLTGELYVWSTTQRNLPSSMNIVAIANPSGTVTRVTVGSTAGMLNGELVVIAGTSASSLNGNWIISIVDATKFDLLGAIYSASTGGTVTIDSIGVGEVGHAVRDIDTNLWTYVTLIRSRVFNFRTKKQPKTYCEKSATLKSLYWTDDYNVPRVLYDRTVNYVNNALLNFIDPLNTYEYATLDIESRLILSQSDITFQFTSQTQTGGAILSGNSRYAVRLKTESNTYTDWTPLSNPIPATIDSEQGSGWAFLGRNSGVVTPKINNFLVTGNILGVFTKIQLATVNYLDGGYSGYIVSETEIPSNSFTIQHTGLETGTQDLDIGTLNAFAQVYSRAKNIDALAGRLILSNLESTPEIDLTDFFSSLEYSIERKTITESTGSAINASLDVGEYQLSDNVYEFAGYMLNERYRFGFVVEWRSGGLSPVFYGTDVVFDRNAASHKTVNIPDYNICVNGGGSPPFLAYPYAHFVRFSIDPESIINGRKLKDIARRVYVWRCPVDTPQVLACGFVIPAINGQVGGVSVNMGWGHPVFTAGVNNLLGEFPFVAGYETGDFIFPAPDVVTNYAYPDNGGTSTRNFVIQNHYGSFYFPDLFMGNTSISPNIGTDKIFLFGQPLVDFQSYPGSGTPHDYLLEAYDAPGEFTTFNTMTPTEIITIAQGEEGTINSLTYSKRLWYEAAGGHALDAPAGMVMYFSGSTLVKVTSNSDAQPFYYVQYVRPIASADDQYGTVLDSKYMFTGAILDCEDTATTVDVYGGDTVSQKCWFKDRYPTFHGIGTDFGQGFGWYNQCRINFQMRTNNSATVPTFPTLSAAGAVQRWLNNVDTEPLIYNKGYNISTKTPDTVQLLGAFNPDPEASNTNFPVRVAWSNNKIPESAQDSYRIFLPLNFKDLDYKNGEIFHHAIANGELITWQILCIMRQYFDSTAMLKSATGVEIILGDGGVLQRRGSTITTYGTKNGFSICKGKTSGGNDAFYFVDTTNRAIFRLILFGDGTVNLGIVHGMDSFFANHLRFVDGVDTPADGLGICSVWNERNKEAIFTVRGYKGDISEWLEGSTYSIGNVVSYVVTDFEEFPDFYVSLINSNTGNVPNVDSSTAWSKISHSDGDYYNEYTIAFNETTNGWDTFYSFKPKIYLPFKNTYLSAKPIDSEAEIYEHGRGDYAVWYQSQIEDGFYESIINALPDDIKSFYGMRFRTDVVPYRVDVYTSAGQHTFMLAADFTFREMNYDAGVRNDLVSGSPTADGNKLWGDFARVKLTFHAQQYQKLYEYIMRAKVRPRENQS